MGISDREYYREDTPEHGVPYGMSRSPHQLSAVGWIIAITGVCYFLQLLIPSFDDWIDLSWESVRHGQIWRLVTYAFAHDRFSLLHILFNMYILYLVARDFEIRRGSREFVVVYLAAAAASGLFFLCWGWFLRSTGSCIGASGAVDAFFLIYALRYPHQVWRIFFVFPVEVIWLLVLKVLFDLHPMLLELSRGAALGDQIAHSAHAGGLLFGYLYQRNNWWISKWFSAGGLSHWKKGFQRRPQLKIHKPPADPDLDARVDELLDKIRREGEASLTDEERALLMEASRRARDRKSRFP